MSLELRLLLSLGLTCGLVLVLTPWVIRVADRFEFHDKPASGYKNHARPTPYLGGLAVMGAFVVAISLLSGNPSRTLPVIAGVIVLWALGTIDDRHDISPLIRVLVEIALATGLWALGLGWNIGFGGALDLALTVLWVLAVVNAINLFDNMDGQAGTMACVIAAAIAILGVVQGDQWVAVTGAALAGSCLGFLRYNLARPARIFLGDGGSMPLGFALACLVMIGVSESVAAAQALAMGLLFVGVPALDTALVIISRRRRGISILTGGRDHLTHRSRERLRTTTAVAFALGGSQAVLAALALASYRSSSKMLLVAVVIYLIAAGAVIIFLDAREPAGSDSSGQATPPVETEAGDGRRRLAGLRWETVPIVALAGAIAVSPWFYGGYSSGIWAPAGLVLMVILIALLIGRPAPITKPAAIALTGLVGLAAWSLVSSSWSSSSHLATVAADRWAFYAMALAVLLMLIRDTRLAAILLTANGIGVLALALVIIVTLAGSDPGSVFAGGRLNAPMGYINGLATYLLMGLWGAIALAEQRGRPALAAIGAGAGALLVPLLMMSQSRGVALAILVSLAVAMIAVPGRLRRFALICLMAVVGAANVSATQLAFYARNSVISTQDAQTIVGRAVMVAALAGLAWYGGSAAIEWCRGARPDLLTGMRRALMILIAAGSLGVTVAAVVNADRITDRVDRAATDFAKTGRGARAHSSTTRLLSGNGARYDYWRVALGSWSRNPVVGSGAGSFGSEYARHRDTSENVRQPHSLELEVLGELGLVGAILLLAVITAILVGGLRLARLGGRSMMERSVAVASIGGFTAWLTDASVDWLHLLTGVTGFAVCASAVMLRPAPKPIGPAPAVGSEADGRRWPRPTAWLLAATVSLLLLAAGALLGRLTLSERYYNRAKSELATDPRAAETDASRAIWLDPTFVDAYYVKSGALSRIGNITGARRALTVALREEPDNFVTLALLGDFEYRQGNRSAAEAFYRRASALNPKDPTISSLAANPAASRD